MALFIPTAGDLSRHSRTVAKRRKGAGALLSGEGDEGTATGTGDDEVRPGSGDALPSEGGAELNAVPSNPGGGVIRYVTRPDRSRTAAIAISGRSLVIHGRF